jgi:GNAT superfamily N-acetyltransferase
MRAGDVPRVVEAVRLVYEEYGFTWDPEGYHADLYRAHEEYGPPSAAFWVAERDGQIVGCMGMRRFPRLAGDVGEIVLDAAGARRAGGCDGELVRLYVRPEWRRRGFGRALTLTGIEWARANGVAAIELWSDKRFDKARALYLSLGARIVGERICHDPDASPEWGMVIPLGVR